MGKSAPKVDKRIGEAAMLAAQTGQEYLAFMSGQAGIANDWAAEDRARSIGVFQPMEDRLIAEASTYDSPERKAKAAAEAVADVRQQTAVAEDARQRQMASMGVRPDAGRARAEDRRADTAGALAAAGAGNMARRQTEATAEALRANTVNLGRGLAVNPATSLGLANGAASAGFSGAQQGYQAQASILNQQHQNQVAAWQAKNDMYLGLGHAAGSLLGASSWGASLLSSKDAKTNKRREIGILDAVKDMPVERWNYKEGMADGGEHVGPYAEDFQKATGLGDGKTISIIDAIGVNMGATKELAAQVDALAEKVGKMGKAPKHAAPREMSIMEAA